MRGEAGALRPRVAWCFPKTCLDANGAYILAGLILVGGLAVGIPFLAGVWIALQKAAASI